MGGDISQINLTKKTFIFNLQPNHIHTYATYYTNKNDDLQRVSH
jgi:hypothetical protein